MPPPHPRYESPPTESEPHPLTYLIGFLGFVGAFGLAVFIHELGHFLFAKMFGVRVERFVIGFDKQMFGFMPNCIWERKIGETTYGLSLVPLGGYVKMTGPVHPEIMKYLEGEDIAPEEFDKSAAGHAVADQGALYQRPLYQKILIYSGGVLMNFVLAMVLLAVINIRGVMVDVPKEPVVGWLAPENLARTVGLLPGDRITALDGTAITNNKEYAEALDSEDAWGDAKSRTFGLSLERDGAPLQLTITATVDEPLLDDLFNVIGQPARVDDVIPSQPADKAGIKPGDVVTAIDGEPIEDFAHFLHIVRGSVGKDLRMALRRESEELEVTVRPRQSSLKDGEGQIGVAMGSAQKVLRKLPPIQAIRDAPFLVYNNITRYLSGLKMVGKNIVTMRFEAVRHDLSGPVGIAQFASRAANKGLSSWLQFLIMLNIALGVMNALPIPVLDGGHIVFAVYEKLRGKPLSPAIFVKVLNGALIFFLAFFVFVSLSDVFKIFG